MPTPNIGLPLPVTGNSVADEFFVLQLQTLLLIDSSIYGLLQAVAGKANTIHGHTMANIDGLVSALAGKMPSTRTFTMRELTDVVGFQDAPNGYIPVKVGSQVIFQSGLSALGTHYHPVDQITGLQELLAAQTASVQTIIDGLGSMAQVDYFVGTANPTAGQGADNDLYFQLD